MCFAKSQELLDFNLRANTNTCLDLGKVKSVPENRRENLPSFFQGQNVIFHEKKNSIDWHGENRLEINEIPFTVIQL